MRLWRPRPWRPPQPALTAALGLDVLQRLSLCQRAQLLQALVLDLPDPLARDVERPSDLVQRARMLAIQPVAELENSSLAGREAAQHAPQRRFAQLHLGNFVRQSLVLVREEVTELGFLVVADRLLERHRRLRAPPDRLDLGGVELELVADLPGIGFAPELGAQLPLRSHDLVQLLDDVDRHPDRPCLVGKRPGDCLANPPGRVGRKLEPLTVIELLGGTNEADRALLDQVEERQTLVPVLLRDRDDKA